VPTICNVFVDYHVSSASFINIMATRRALTRRHISIASNETTNVPHWGYADRVTPCLNDAGSCKYLDIVYAAHDLGMYYTGIIWATIGTILLLWAIARRFSQPSGASLPVQSGEAVKESSSAWHRLQRAFPSYARRYLLPDAAKLLFGRVTRTQVLTLVVLTGYLTVFSFVGIVWGKWVTPVKKLPGVYNTRSSLGPWSDRIGVLAYALTPLSIMLSSRESILSLVTGIPYQSFNFLHRWLGYIICVQSVLHTIGWVVIETKLYQPQPTTGKEWIVQPYMVWGCVAILLLLLLVALSTTWVIRLTGYELFRKVHYILAMIYIGACWGHWAQLKVFLLPGLLVWFIDRGIRFIRTGLLHYNFLPSGHMGFRASSASITFFKDSINGDVVRLDYDHPHDSWDVGQHFYLMFPESSIWQSHPFTPLSLPVYGADTQRHSYVFRAKKGETKRIALLSSKRAARAHDHEEAHEGLVADARLSVVMAGPYGERTMHNIPADSNILCIAGGTGITYVLPVLLDLASRPQTIDRRMSLVWVIRRRSDLDWVAPELAVLQSKCPNLRTNISIYVTRAGEDAYLSAPAASEKAITTDCTPGVEISTVPASNSSSQSLCSALSIHGVSKADMGLTHYQARPNLDTVVSGFVANTVRGGTDVFASGPGEMISDLRNIVAAANRGLEVWRGENRWDVRLTCDDRLEW
jgi:predicted ferric reductase